MLVSLSACATSTRSKTFYDAALAPLGYKCIRAARTLASYGYGPDSISFWVVAAERPVPADEKSGLHFCFAAPNAAAVDAFHAAQAGVDNGAPRFRVRVTVSRRPPSGRQSRPDSFAGLQGEVVCKSAPKRDPDQNCSK